MPRSAAFQRFFCRCGLWFPNWVTLNLDVWSFACLMPAKQTLIKHVAKPNIFKHHVFSKAQKYHWGSERKYVNRISLAGCSDHCHTSHNKTSRTDGSTTPTESMNQEQLLYTTIIIQYSIQTISKWFNMRQSLPRCLGTPRFIPPIKMPKGSWHLSVYSASIRVREILQCAIHTMTGWNSTTCRFTLFYNHRPWWHSSIPLAMTAIHQAWWATISPMGNSLHLWGSNRSLPAV